MAKTAALFGATGLVGSACLDLLLADARYERVHVIGRRVPVRTHPKLTSHAVGLEPDALAGLPADSLDVVFSCLGTTIAKAGSQEAFRRVDFDYVMNAAQFAKLHGAAQFLMVTAVGAAARSSVFYSRVKGEIEDAVAGIGIPSVAMFRPSFILGPRAESRAFERAAKSLGQMMSFALVGSLSKYRPIHADTIARAMLQAAELRAPGTGVYEYDQMSAMAGGGVVSR